MMGKIVTPKISLWAPVWMQAQGASFAGAYDAIPSLVHVYELRRTLTAYTGNLIRLRRASDNAEADFGYTASGALNTAAIATWLGGANGYIVTIYDQVGSADFTQATASAQPLYVASVQNSKPVGRWDGSDDGLGNADAFNLAQFTAMVGWRQTTFIEYQRLLDHRGLGLPGAVVGWQLKNGGSTDWVICDDGASQYVQLTTVSPTNGAHINTMVYAGTNLLSGYLDAVSVGVKSGTDPVGSILSAKVCSIGREIGGSSTQIYAGDIFAIAIANAALSDANRNALRTAMNNYWGVY